MSKNNNTVFQRLHSVFSGGSTLKTYTTNTYNINTPNHVVDTAKTKEEYDMKILQLKQQKYLNSQWIKTQYEIENNSYAGLNNVKLMYRDCDLMDGFPEIGAALDIYAEESTYNGENNSIINISSKSERIKSILSDLYNNRLSANITIPMIVRNLCKYGNCYMLHNIDKDYGIKGWKQLPVYDMERYEAGMEMPYSTTPNVNTVDEEKINETTFIFNGMSSTGVKYRNWQISHFRLLYDSQFLPYGVSMLHKARRHFRMLSMMEDMMLIYRLDRSIERRVFKINVGSIDSDDVKPYIESIANNFKRTQLIDPTTGQLDLRKNIMNNMEDFFIPVRDDNASSPIETLPSGQNLTAMDDIKYVQNKILTALRMPRSFLNFEESEGEGKNLSLLDVRFSRTINRIQQAILMELYKVGIIHLYLLGFYDELTNFTLTMNNPSSQAEMLELENLSKKFQLGRDAVSDPGNGIPLASTKWVWKHVFHLSENEIQNMYNELRLEAALGIELKKTSQIIKKTGVFDSIDNIYGEIGAEYLEDNQGGEGPDGNMGGMPGGGGGGFPIGGGDLDFGNEGEEPNIGNEGEMNMSDAMKENGDNNDLIGNLNSENNMPNIGEAFKMHKNKKQLNESNNKGKKLNEKEEKKDVNLYDQTFIINEDLTDMINKLKNNINNNED